MHLQYIELSASKIKQHKAMHNKCTVWTAMHTALLKSKAVCWPMFDMCFICMSNARNNACRHEPLLCSNSLPLPGMEGYQKTLPQQCLSVLSRPGQTHWWQTHQGGLAGWWDIENSVYQPLSLNPGTSSERVSSIDHPWVKSYARGFGKIQTNQHNNIYNIHILLLFFFHFIDPNKVSGAS